MKVWKILIKQIDPIEVELFSFEKRIKVEPETFNKALFQLLTEKKYKVAIENETFDLNSFTKTDIANYIKTYISENGLQKFIETTEETDQKTIEKFKDIISDFGIQVKQS